jgi:cytochrome c-type biogenesis protein CcmH
MKAFHTPLILLSLLLAIAGSVGAVEIRTFEDPAKAERYDALIHKLRCLVCQNQSLGDSDADLARDLRTEVYERIESGESEEETLKFLTDRYGDFVLYDPPFKNITLILWIGPLFLLAAGGFISWRHIGRHRTKDATRSLDPDAIQRLETLKNQIRKDRPNTP